MNAQPLKMRFYFQHWLVLQKPWDRFKIIIKTYSKLSCWKPDTMPNKNRLSVHSANSIPQLASRVVEYYGCISVIYFVPTCDSTSTGVAMTLLIYSLKNRDLNRSLLKYGKLFLYDWGLTWNVLSSPRSSMDLWGWGGWRCCKASVE
jgi:hypothetical protein